MYQMYDNILTISKSDWILAGLTDNQFKRDSQDGLLCIAHRGINGNTLIDVRSIKRPERRMAIERAFGKIDEAGKQAAFAEVERNMEAVAYFRDYTYTDERGTERHLPEEAQRQYVAEASVMDMLRRVEERQRTARAATGKRKTKKEFWAEAVGKVKGLTGEWANKLPQNPRSLERKCDEYREKGFASLVHGMYGKANGKLTEDAKFWLIARFATPIDKVTMQQLFAAYNEEAAKREGWQQLASEQTIRLFLNRPEIKQLWYGTRYGELKSKEKYTRHNKTLLPTKRDTLWYGDGTKLNYYYRDEQGNIRTCNVYEVVDVYSEVLLGYWISDSEDFEAQYMAYRAAVQMSGCIPSELRYDNQGGHNKLDNSQFFAKLARRNIPTAPYNGKSKTIESIFGRFQSQVLHRDWFFTGQNVTAKKAESRENMEFIMANKASLKSLDEIKAIYARRREEWNNGIHYDTGRPRIEMYLESVNENTRKVDMLDMIDIFGLIDSTPNTYTAQGIKKQIKGKTYQWEVLKSDETPDYEFLRRNVDRKFYIGYDMNDLSMVALYTKDAKGYRFEAMAQKYIEIHRAMDEQTDFDRAFIRANERANKALRVDMADEIEDILERNGLHPAQHGLVMARPKGLNLGRKADIGTYTKKVSELVEVDLEDRY